MHTIYVFLIFSRKLFQNFKALLNFYQPYFFPLPNICCLPNYSIYCSLKEYFMVSFLTMEMHVKTYKKKEQQAFIYVLKSKMVDWQPFEVFNFPYLSMHWEKSKYSYFKKIWCFKKNFTQDLLNTSVHSMQTFNLFNL